MTFRPNWRAALAFLHDTCMAAIAWTGIYWLRFNLDLREPFAGDMWFTLAWVLPLQAAMIPAAVMAVSRVSVRVAFFM